VVGEIADGADGDRGAGRVDGDAAAVVVRDGDYVVDVRVVREDLGLDAADCVVDRGGNALNRGGDAEDVAGSYRAVALR
jgi:hypothetical protein